MPNLGFVGRNQESPPVTAAAYRNQDRLLVETIAASDDLIGLLRTSARLAAGAARTADPAAMLETLTELAEVDTFSTLAAMESLARLRHTGADDRLIAYLDHPVEIVRRHAAWRLGDRPLRADACQILADRLAAGGIETMHAHRTLRTWSRADEPLVAEAITGRLADAGDPAARARLVDALGAMTDSATNETLIRLALDSDEAMPARIAAVGSLGFRPGPGVEDAMIGLARNDDDLGVHAATAIGDLCAPAVYHRSAASPGLRIAQLTLAGELDGRLSRGGRGDTGGVASLLVSLGEALVRRDDVAHVLTIGRGVPAAVVADQLVPDHGKLAYGTLAYGDQARPGASPGDSWEHLPTIERGVARVLRDRPEVDVLHLRMADVGALAGLGAAASLGIDTCFSLAPDPHGVIQSMQDQGKLDRRSFVDLAASDHVWFRARLVERLATEASRLALFPRADLDSFFTVPDGADGGPRRPSVVVPEGIDLTLTERAEETLGQSRDGDRPVPKVLADLAARIPQERRHLPLLLSVGRFNPIKGMDRVAEAWARDPRLYQSCTLVIVGGSLIDPTPVEQSVLDAIARAVPESSPAQAGLVLLGGRPREDVALLLAATGSGHPGGWAGGGTYVDGAYKEEFGLALIEALAAGLVVTAPSVGGPPSYVEPDVTGVLVDPEADLGPAILRAFTLVDRPGRAGRVRRLVEERYSVDTMADRLVGLYDSVPILL